MDRIIQFLNVKTASKLGTANKKSRNEARRRMNSQRARGTRVAHQAARVGRARYKLNKKSRNLNRIYESLRTMGIENHASWFRNDVNSFVNLYGNLKNNSLTRAEHERLQRKMRKWKNELINEIQKRNNQRRRIHNMNILDNY